MFKNNERCKIHYGNKRVNTESVKFSVLLKVYKIHYTQLKSFVCKSNKVPNRRATLVSIYLRVIYFVRAILFTKLW